MINVTDRKTPNSKFIRVGSDDRPKSKKSEYKKNYNSRLVNTSSIKEKKVSKNSSEKSSVKTKDTSKSEIYYSMKVSQKIQNLKKSKV